MLKLYGISYVFYDPNMIDTKKISIGLKFLLVSKFINIINIATLGTFCPYKLVVTKCNVVYTVP